jgi:uncharacterized membrane protein YeaQ/YmgE (transglycosylase-associated protein family)
MDLLIVVLIGMGIGIMVELLLPGHTASELFLAVALAVAGALAANYIGAMAGWYGTGEPTSFLSSCVGAVVILLAWGLCFRRDQHQQR